MVISKIFFLINLICFSINYIEGNTHNMIYFGIFAIIFFIFAMEKE